MPGSYKITAFVATRDPERARAFYRDTLGLRLVREELPFALLSAIPPAVHTAPD